MSSVLPSKPVNLFRSGLLGIGNNMNFWNDGDCPVCSTSARSQVVFHIMGMIQMNGRFAVQSVEDFWNTFGTNLCVKCKNDLSSISEIKKQAKELLEESLRIKYDNVTEKNLEAVKSMM